MRDKLQVGDIVRFTDTPEHREIQLKYYHRQNGLYRIVKCGHSGSFIAPLDAPELDRWTWFNSRFIKDPFMTSALGIIRDAGAD